MSSGELLRGESGIVNLVDVVGVSIDTFGTFSAPYYLAVILRGGGTVVLESFQLVGAAESALDAFEATWFEYLEGSK